MFAGHVGAGLAFARADRRVNVGVFVAAALLADIALFAFVLLGWESLSIPADFATRHQLAFVFPYTHGLAGSLVWSVAEGTAAFVISRRGRTAALVGAAVFSHWILDALVHRPELPLLGAGSKVVGLGLWDHPALALGIESALVVSGLGAFLRGSGLSRGKAIGLVALAIAILALTIVGLTSGSAPPSATVVAASSLVTLLLVCALSFWIGRTREEDR